MCTHFKEKNYCNFNTQYVAITKYEYKSCIRFFGTPGIYPLSKSIHNVNRHVHIGSVKLES